MIEQYLNPNTYQQEVGKTSNTSKAKEVLEGNTNKKNNSKNPHTYRREADELFVRGLRLRIFFEQGNADIIGHCQAFEGFLNRNKTLSKKLIATYLNFIELTKKIDKERLRGPYTPIEAEQIRAVFIEQIETMELLVCRNWLYRQVEQVSEECVH